MSLLTIAQSVARNVSISVPTEVMSNTDDEIVKLLQFITEAAEEIARRVDWGVLRTAHALDTSNGDGGHSSPYTNATFDLPEDFSRLVQGMAVYRDGAVPIRGGISADEWNSLSSTVQASPRYFRIVGAAIGFYPYPEVTDNITVVYQSKNWCSNGSNAWEDDTRDSTVFPEELVVKGTIWRWKRYVGTDFQDFMAEYEAALADYARFDAGARLP